MDKLAYLAIPYSGIAEESFRIANEVAAELILQGYIVFSPISHSHPIAEYMTEEQRYSQELWMKQDITWLKKCDELILIQIGDKGTELIENSKGCQAEIRMAKALGLPIKYYEYE